MPSSTRVAASCISSTIDTQTRTLPACARTTPLFPPRSETPDCLAVLPNLPTSPGLAGGHYYTYARTLSKVRTAEWYNYNDSYVSKMSADSVRTPNAYILFYQRRAWNGGHQGPPIVPTPADDGGAI